MCLGKCLTCIGINKQFLARQAAGREPDNAAPPVIKDAVSMVPAWQQMQVQMQTVFGCCSVPSCMEHIEVKEMSHLERAVLGGQILPGGPQ